MSLKTKMIYLKKKIKYKDLDYDIYRQYNYTIFTATV